MVSKESRSDRGIPAASALFPEILAGGAGPTPTLGTGRGKRGRNSIIPEAASPQRSLGLASAACSFHAPPSSLLPCRRGRNAAHCSEYLISFRQRVSCNPDDSSRQVRVLPSDLLGLLGFGRASVALDKLRVAFTGFDFSFDSHVRVDFIRFVYDGNSRTMNTGCSCHGRLGIAQFYV